jgi:hypothetical protein
MMLQVSDYTVLIDPSGDVMGVAGPNSMSIPPDPGNSRYQEFLAVDTEAHLCERVTVPEPAANTAPTTEERLAAAEAALLALMGV